MIQTVSFRRVDKVVHKKVKAKSAIVELPIYKLYNYAMADFSERMKRDQFLVHFEEAPGHDYKDIRVEKVDNRIYKSFKVTCVQKDISISQGINLALVSWLEVCENDISSLELRT